MISIIWMIRKSFFLRYDERRDNSNLLGDKMHVDFQRERVNFKMVAIAIVLLLPLLMSGCGKKGGASALKGGALAPKKVSLPSDITSSKELLEVSVLVTLPRQNPFESILFKDEVPEVIVEAPVENKPKAPKINPFLNMKLGGIIFKSDRPMAILQMGDADSKIVREGERLSNSAVTGSPEIEVVKIEKEAIHLYAPNQDINLSVKTLSVPSLIGFKSEGDKTASAATGKGTTTSAASGNDMDISGLPAELQAILKTQMAQSADSKKKKAAQPNLGDLLTTPTTADTSETSQPGSTSPQPSAPSSMPPGLPPALQNLLQPSG